MLAATVGLRPESVGRVRMRLNEGLAGLVAEELQPQVVADATRASAIQVLRRGGRGSVSLVPRRARSIDRGVLQGVLVVQTVEPRSFGERRRRGC